MQLNSLTFLSVFENVFIFLIPLISFDNDNRLLGPYTRKLYIFGIIYLLPPATKLGQGYVFTRVCDSVHGGGGIVSQHALQISRPTPRGEVEGSGLGKSPGQHRGGERG